MNIVIPLLAISIATSVCIAQNINISGIVTDTGSSPISGSAVILEKCGLTDSTETDGKFMFTAVGINNHIQSQHKLSVRVNNSMLHISVAEKSLVEITTFSLQGKVISTLQRIMNVGPHSITLPHFGAGVYFHKVKSGSSEFVLKNCSIGGVSAGTTASIHGSSSPAFTRQSTSKDIIDDVIKVTKVGYLNKRINIVANSDTSGIKIELIIQDTGTVTDIDGNVYHTIRIGNQVWTVENLRTTKYNDGSAIPLVTDSAAWDTLISPGYCYYNNTINTDSIKKFGALYNWYVVGTKKLAPTGWYVPDSADWVILKDYLTDNGYNWDGTLYPSKIAKAMAAKTDWDSTEICEIGDIGYNRHLNNSCGFSALPTGFRSSNGNFYRIGLYSNWWTTTESDTSRAYYRLLHYDLSYLYGFVFPKVYGYSVRLVRDFD